MYKVTVTLHSMLAFCALFTIRMAKQDMCTTGVRCTVMMKYDIIISSL